MSSSTMIQGATSRRASAYRMLAETTTSPASQTHVGTARTSPSARDGARMPAVSTAKTDFSEALRKLTGLLEADLGRCGRDVAEDRRLHRLAAGGLLECARVQLGHAVETMLALDEVARRVTHRAPHPGVGGEKLERRGHRVHLVLVDGHLQRDGVRQLREPPDVADDERLPDREGSNHAPGGLSHRRRAQADAGVTACHQSPETRFVDIALADDTLGLEPPFQPRRRPADEQEPRLRPPLAEP